jgi:hypothetical protein
VERPVGTAVGEGSSGVAQIGIVGPCSNGDNGGGVRGIGGVMGSGWGDRADGGGEQWGGERRVSSSPSYLSSSASQLLFTTFLVYFAGGGEGIGEKRRGDVSGGGCSSDEFSDHEDSGSEGLETVGAVEAGIAVTMRFADLPTVVFRRRRRRRRRAAGAAMYVDIARRRQESVIS